MLSAAQVEPTAEAGRASAGPKQDHERVFPPLEEPDDHLNARRSAQGAAKSSAGIRLLGGWVLGLIDELTMDQWMRMQAEDTAKIGTKAPTAFRGQGGAGRPHERRSGVDGVRGAKRPGHTEAPGRFSPSPGVYATGPVAAEIATPGPAAFVAVTTTRSRKPESAAVTA
jgi:hypothetical protein